jgi:hypothetical protein
MRGLGTGTLVLVLALGPLALACSFAPRMQGCREPMTDFSDIDSIHLDVLGFSGAGVDFESRVFSFQVVARARTRGDGPRCVEIESVIEGPTGERVSFTNAIEATQSGTEIRTTDFIYYRLPAGSPFTVRATALGRETHVTVTIDGPIDAGADAP